MNKNSFLCANLYFYFYVLHQKYFFNPNVFLFYLINNSQQSFP